MTGKIIIEAREDGGLSIDTRVKNVSGFDEVWLLHSIVRAFHIDRDQMLAWVISELTGSFDETEEIVIDRRLLEDKYHDE